MKKVVITARISTEDLSDFKKLCTEQYTTPSAAINKFIKKRVDKWEL